MQTTKLVTQEEWLLEARQAAVRRLQSNYTMTLEDLLDICPKPAHLPISTIRKVFSADTFQPIGYSRSKRPGAQKRIIRVYTLQEAYFPPSQLAHRRRNIDEFKED